MFLRHYTLHWTQCYCSSVCGCVVGMSGCLYVCVCACIYMITKPYIHNISGFLLFVTLDPKTFSLELHRFLFVDGKNASCRSTFYLVPKSLRY